MHSRIYQVSKAPINKDDFITEDRYYDGFVGSIADYVSDEVDINGELECLRSLLEGKGAAEFTPDCTQMTIVNKRAFFESKYESWKALAADFASISFDEFCGEEGDLYFKHSLVEDMFDDKFSFYMDDNDEYYGLQTFSSFMRSAKDGDTYYLGAVIDYHF